MQILYSSDSFELCYWKYPFPNICMYLKIGAEHCIWCTQSFFPSGTPLEDEAWQEILAQRLRKQPNNSFQEVL